MEKLYTQEEIIHLMRRLVADENFEYTSISEETAIHFFNKHIGKKFGEI